MSQSKLSNIRKLVTTVLTDHPALMPFIVVASTLLAALENLGYLSILGILISLARNAILLGAVATIVYILRK